MKQFPWSAPGCTCDPTDKKELKCCESKDTASETCCDDKSEDCCKEKEETE